MQAFIIDGPRGASVGRGVEEGASINRRDTYHHSSSIIKRGPGTWSDIHHAPPRTVDQPIGPQIRIKTKQWIVLHYSGERSGLL